jgi:hypothetical protein
MAVNPTPVDGTTRTPFKTPDITPAQITAIVGFVASVAAAFGLDVSDSLRDALVQGGTALLIILPAVDAIIRHGRSKVAAAQVTAAADVRIAETPVVTTGGTT